MTPTTKYGLIVFSFATIFAFGRFSAPTKVVTETKIVEVEKKSSELDRDKNKVTFTKMITRPDGTKETETKVVEETHTELKKQSDSAKTSDDLKEVTRGTGKLSIAALGALNVRELTSPPVFGVHVQRSILGPITVGAFGFSNGIAGVSLGLTF